MASGGGVGARAGDRVGASLGRFAERCTLWWTAVSNRLNRPAGAWGAATWSGMMLSSSIDTMVRVGSILGRSASSKGMIVELGTIRCFRNTFWVLTTALLRTDTTDAKQGKEGMDRGTPAGS